MAWNTNTSYSSSYKPLNTDFQGIGNDFRTHGGDVNVNGFKLANIGSYTSSGQPRIFSVQSSGSSIPNAAWTPIPMDTDLLITGFTRSGGAITVPVDGMYLCTGVVVFTPNSTGVRYAQWYYPFAAQLSGFAADRTPHASDPTAVVLPTVPLFLNAGHNIQIAAYQNSGGALNSSSGASWYTFISLVQLC